MLYILVDKNDEKIIAACVEKNVAEKLQKERGENFTIKEVI